MLRIVRIARALRVVRLLLARRTSSPIMTMTLSTETTAGTLSTAVTVATLGAARVIGHGGSASLPNRPRRLPLWGGLASKRWVVMRFVVLARPSNFGARAALHLRHRDGDVT